MTTGFNPEQLKRIALAKRMERDAKVPTEQVEVEPLPDQETVDKIVQEIETWVVASADEGDLSYEHKFAVDIKAKLVNEVSIQFKKKHPRLMIVTKLGPEKSITFSWDGLNHV